MATAFLDSSALFRRYFQAEPGAGRVRAFCAPTMRNALFVARLAPIELASAFARRLRDGTLTPAAYRRRWRTFRLDWDEQYAVIDLNSQVYAVSECLVTRYPLRSLDALPLATALTVAAREPRLGFWTADRQQAAAADAEGLGVELLG